MPIEIKKKDINLKYSDMANMFDTYYDDNGNKVFSMNRTLTFANIDKLNEKYVTKYIWQEYDTWYKLSYSNYENAKLWWIICRANNIKNPLELPEVGTTINIPSIGIVNSILDQIKL